MTTLAVPGPTVARTAVTAAGLTGAVASAALISRWFLQADNAGTTRRSGLKRTPTAHTVSEGITGVNTRAVGGKCAHPVLPEGHKVHSEGCRPSEGFRRVG